MSRWLIAVRGFGFLLAVPLAIAAAVEMVDTVQRFAASGDGNDVGQVGVAAAALVLLNAILLFSPSLRGAATLVIGHVVLAPPTAFFCFFSIVDPVAAIFALPLLALVAVTLRPASCPLAGAAAWR